MNHHKFTNRAGDYTLTYRYTEKNNLLTLLSYPTISGYHQQRPIRDYLRDLWGKNRRRFWGSIGQYLALAAFIGAGLVFAGITDTCGMGLLLARMPWNQVKDAPAKCCATKEV
jgi:hypothetical protein